MTLRELAQNEISPRFERVDGVAAVNVNGGLRRQIHVELSKEKITALNLSVNQVVKGLRQENQNTPLGEVYQGDATFLVRSQGQFTSLDDIRNLVVMTRDGVPVYLRDIAEVKDATEQRRSFMRINGKPGVQLQVQKQSGENTVEVAHGIKAEVERINREVPGIKMIVMQDNSLFIERAINNVQEHALIGGVLVVLIIFAFLRDFRSTLIVCTSIPVSVIGTFALLYFGGFTLNTMTFGGLALGIGMIVDAAIVVLENTHRHLHMGKDRMTAAIDGSEEVWSAILASTLTHIAVFVPLLFLSGTASILFTQLSVVVMFSLVDVALRRRHHRAGALLALAAHARRGARGRRGSWRRSTASARASSSAMDEGYRKAIHVALNHRPTVIGAAVALVVVARSDLSAHRRRADAADRRGRGQRQRRARRRHARRAHRRGAAPARGDGRRRTCPEATTIITNGGGGGGNNFGGGGGGGGQTNRGQIHIQLVPRDQRTRTNEEISIDLRRQLAGLPGVIVRANPAGGNFQLQRLLGGGGNDQDARLALEIRGHDLDDARRVAVDAQQLMEATPGIADVRVGREEGRPEISVRVDRPKAATLGLTVSGVATTIQTNVAGTTAAQFRERGNEYPIVVRLRQADREEVNDVGDVLAEHAHRPGRPGQERA